MNTALWLGCFKSQQNLLLDQQNHDILTVMSFSYSTPTCFDVFTSSSGSLFLYMLKLQNQFFKNFIDLVTSAYIRKYSLKMMQTHRNMSANCTKKTLLLIHSAISKVHSRTGHEGPKGE
jgi:hypothetical protein